MLHMTGWCWGYRGGAGALLYTFLTEAIFEQENEVA